MKHLSSVTDLYMFCLKLTVHPPLSTSMLQNASKLVMSSGLMVYTPESHGFISVQSFGILDLKEQISTNICPVESYV